MMNGGEKLDEYNKTFFYSLSMLSAGREHADREHADLNHDAAYYYNVLYNRMRLQSDIARLQAESITDDPVLVKLISEQIMNFYSPSMNYIENMQESEYSCSPEGASGYEGKVW